MAAVARSVSDSAPVTHVSTWLSLRLSIEIANLIRRERTVAVNPRVVIAGAGIVGACVAYALSREGAKVCLVDRNDVPAQGVTGCSFGWISTVMAADDVSDQMYRLRCEAYARYHALNKMLGGRLFELGEGAFVWKGGSAETAALARLHTTRWWAGGAGVMVTTAIG